MTKSKSDKIQILRGVAIIAVVSIHCLPLGLVQVFIRPFLNFSVGLFLFLSGMMTDVNKLNVKKRILKVLIPYVIWTFIYTIRFTFKEPINIPISFIKHIIAGDSAAIMYYIWVYIELTLLIPFIDKLAKTKYKYLGFLISPIEIIIMRLIPLLLGVEFNSFITTIQSLSCLGWFTYYYLGYLFGNELISLRIKNTNIALCLLLSIVIQIMEGYLYYRIGDINCGTQLKLSSLVTGIIIDLFAFRFICSEINYKLNYLAILGNYSFGIYFSHLFIKSFLYCIPYYMQYVVFPVSVVVLILLSLLFVIIGRKLIGKNGKYLAL